MNMTQRAYLLNLGTILFLAGILFIAIDNDSYGAAYFLGVFHLGVSVAVILAYFFIRLTKRMTRIQKRAFSRRMYLPFVLRLSALFVLGVLLARYVPFESDFSEGAQYSLSGGSKRLLAELKAPITLFQVEIGETSQLKAESRILKRFSRESTLLSVKSIHAVYDFELIEKLGITSGTRVVITREGYEPIRLSEITEKTISLGIARMNAQKPLRVFFSVGHGELDMQSSAPGGGSRLAQLLESEGAQLSPLVISEEVSADLEESLILLLTPQKSFSADEEGHLQDFVERGANVLGTFEGGDHVPTIFRREGIEILPSAAVRVLQTQGGERQFSADLSIRLYPRHPITSFLQGEASVFFSRAYPIAMKGALSPRLVERNSLLRYKTNGAEGKTGPALEFGAFLKMKNGARLQLYGDGSWLTNQFLDRAYNRELMRGAVLWGGGIIEEERIYAAPREASVRSFVDRETIDVILLLFILATEGLMLWGVVLLWRRRRLAITRLPSGSASR